MCWIAPRELLDAPPALCQLCLRLYPTVDSASATVEALWTLKKKSIAKLVAVRAEISNVAWRKPVLAQPAECTEGSDVGEVKRIEKKSTPKQKKTKRAGGERLCYF